MSDDYIKGQEDLIKQIKESVSSVIDSFESSKSETKSIDLMTDILLLLKGLKPLVKEDSPKIPLDNGYDDKILYLRRSSEVHELRILSVTAEIKRITVQFVGLRELRMLEYLSQTKAKSSALVKEFNIEFLDLSLINYIPVMSDDELKGIANFSYESHK